MIVRPTPEIGFDGHAYFAELPALPALPEIDLSYLPSNVHLHIDLGRHRVGADFELSRDRFNACDIYVPETPGHEADSEAIFNQFAQMPLDPQQMVAIGRVYDADSFENAELVALAGSEKQIIVVDASSKLVTSALADQEALDARFGNGTAGMEEGLQYIYEKSWRDVYDDAVRERTMLTDLGPKIHAVLRRRPDLQDKEVVHVLMRVGARHQAIIEPLMMSEHTKEQVSATSLNYRTLESTDFMAEREIWRLIQANQPVDRELLLIQNLANSIALLFPIAQTGAREQGLDLDVTNTMISHFMEINLEGAVGKLGQVVLGIATADEMELISLLHQDIVKHVSANAHYA